MKVHIVNGYISIMQVEEPSTLPPYRVLVKSEVVECCQTFSMAERFAEFAAKVFEIAKRSE